MAKKNEDEMSFLEHLEELRWHLVRAILGIFVAA
ncbi:MAG: twin-arginine translocase subunit TatC, partial [Bacteroidota bacterium]